MRFLVYSIAFQSLRLLPCVWQRLATDLKPRCLAGVTRTIDFDQLRGAFDDYIQGRVKGRTVVRIGA